MRIKEVSKITGLTEYTLRYYEKIGLLKIQKSPNGHRNYSKEDISWIEFINRLKITGMPIKEITIYSNLRAHGHATLKARLNLLEDHESRISNDLIRLQNNLIKLRDKINYYRKEIK